MRPTRPAGARAPGRSAGALRRGLGRRSGSLADPTITDKHYQSTPLGWARHFGQPALAELLEPPQLPRTRGAQTRRRRALAVQGTDE
jgi:hypothetical protein